MSQEDIVRFDDLLQVDRIVFFRSTLERIEYGYQITTGEAVLCVCVGDVVGVGIVQVEDLVHGADLERLVDVLEYRSLGFVDALHLLDVGEVLHALVGLLEGKGQAREELEVYPVNVVLGQLPRLHDVGVVQVAVAREVLVVPDVIVERVRSEDAEEDEKDEDTVAAHQLVDQHENFEQLVVCFRILIAACGVLGPIRFVDFNLSCV